MKGEIPLRQASHYCHHERTIHHRGKYYAKWRPMRIFVSVTTASLRSNDQNQRSEGVTAMTKASIDEDHSRLAKLDMLTKQFAKTRQKNLAVSTETQSVARVLLDTPEAPRCS